MKSKVNLEYQQEKKFKMKKILLILVLVVFLVGCGLMQGGDVRTPTAVDFRKGYGGLEIESLEGLPPKEMYEGGNFKIGIRLKNTGAYDIKRGELEIAGFDESYVILSQKRKNLEPILGKSITNPEGGFYIEEFDGQVLRSLGGAKEYPATYFIISRYDYRSEAQTDVCINTNLYSDLKLSEDSCKPEVSISFSGQGAPVAITKIEEFTVPEGAGAKMVFKLHIENKGKGILTSPVYLEEVQLGNRRLVCEPRFLEWSKEGEKVFVCTAYEAGAANYKTPFYAAIYYTYQIKEKKTLKIKSLQV